MNNLNKLDKKPAELHGYLLEKSIRKMEIFKWIFGSIFIGIIGSGFMCALFVAKTIGTGAWIVGFSGVFLIATMIIAWWREPDLNATYCFSEEQVSTHSRQKKYEKIALWDEIVNVAEVDCVMIRGMYYRVSSSYILLMKKSHIELIELGILATDFVKQKMMYSYLYRQPDIIAIPKTEEVVRFIERKTGDSSVS